MKSFRFVILSSLTCAIILLPGTSIAGEHFDGNWLTKLTCPPKGNTEGYTWQFVSVIQNNALHGERGMADQPGYYSLDGKIAGQRQRQTHRQRHRLLQKICPRRLRPPGRRLQLRSQSSIPGNPGHGHQERRPRHCRPHLHLRIYEAASDGVSNARPGFGN